MLRMRSPRVHRRAPKPRPMPVSRRLIRAVFLSGLPAVPALAADGPDLVCLNKTEQRTAVVGKSAIPLAQVMKTLRKRGHRTEVVRAKLCRRGESLVYLLTLLAGSGKVTSATVDAGNGLPISGHL